MKMIKKFLLVSVMLVCAVELFAASNAEEYVNPKYYDSLYFKGVISLINDSGNNSLELIPNCAYTDKIKANLVSKDPKNYPFTYEVLYLKSKEELLAASKSSEIDITIDDFSRVCRSVSKMEGMYYYSSTRKKDVILYDKAYMLDGPEGKRIDDQNTGNADGQVSYCMQNDSSFGECRYKLNYYQSGNEMMAVFTNLSILGIGPFKAVYPDKLKINILAIDCGDDVLFYICCDLDSKKYPGIKEQITDSMTSRMDAVYNWFIKQF